MTNEEFTTQFETLRQTIDAMAADIAALKSQQADPADPDPDEPNDPPGSDETDLFKTVFGDKS